VRVAVLRPEEYIKDTIELFQGKDFEVIAVPFLRIKVNEEGIKKLEEADDFDVAIVTSQTAAKILSKHCDKFKAKRVLAIGKKTAEVLSESGIESEIPEKFDSKTVYEQYRDKFRDKKVLLLRSDKGDPILLKLSEVADVEEIVLYTIEKNFGEKQKELIKRVVNGEIYVLVFSSSMMVRSFMELAENLNMKNKVINRLNEMRVVAIGPPTAKVLEEYGLKAEIPDEYTFEGIVKLLEKNEEE